MKKKQTAKWILIGAIAVASIFLIATAVGYTSKFIFWNDELPDDSDATYAYKLSLRVHIGCQVTNRSDGHSWIVAPIDRAMQPSATWETLSYYDYLGSLFPANPGQYTVDEWSNGNEWTYPTIHNLLIQVAVKNTVTGEAITILSKAYTDFSATQGGTIGIWTDWHTFGPSKCTNYQIITTFSDGTLTLPGKTMAISTLNVIYGA